MNTTIVILGFLAAIALVVGAIKMVVSLVRAPEGYENGNGFHYIS